MFKTEVKSRFGVLPNFFCSAAAAPGLIEELWGFAKSAYLNNPLPSVFKERLFVHLSRFCEIRYCIVRHVGFLIGAGNPAGDAAAVPQTVETVLALLQRPVPDAGQLERSLARLRSGQPSLAIPETGTQFEADLLDVLTIMFVSPRHASSARVAVTYALGEKTFELLTAYLAFIRTAHYWTETHPTLAYEDDMLAIMAKHPELKRLMLDASDAEWAHPSEALRRALASLEAAAGALRTSEDRFRAFMTATSDVLYRMNADWTEMHSLDGRGFLDTTASPNREWMNQYIHPEDQPRVAADIQEAVRTKRVFEHEHRVWRVDGTLGWTLSRAVPLLDDSGEIIEWFGTAVDITARRKADEALREGDRRKDEFLATLAHELRNPLAPLRNGLHIAKLLNVNSDATFRRTIEMMDRQVNHLVHLVDDLLDLGRINTGKIDLRRENVSLQKVLAASAESCQSAIAQHGHTLVIEPGAEELVIEGDFDRLTQVFSNLLSNAIKYTDQDGTIELRVNQQAGEALVSITDTGIGIPASELSSIFDLFSQVRSHESHAEGGLGIGLSLVRKLVEMHRGSVSANSPGVGQGSTFTVRLPLASRTAEIGAPVQPDSNAFIPRRRVLVIDDNVDAATSLGMLLVELGHEVATEFNGEQGTARAEAMRPDLIFLDLGMPGMNGFEAAKHLRALPCGKQIVLVALTGWGQEGDLRRTRDAGFDHHLLKPIDHEALYRLMAASPVAEKLN